MKTNYQNVRSVFSLLLPFALLGAFLSGAAPKSLADSGLEYSYNPYQPSRPPSVKTIQAADLTYLTLELLRDLKRVNQLAVDYSLPGDYLEEDAIFSLREVLESATLFKESLRGSIRGGVVEQHRLERVFFRLDEDFRVLNEQIRYLRAYHYAYYTFDQIKQTIRKMRQHFRISGFEWSGGSVQSLSRQVLQEANLLLSRIYNGGYDRSDYSRRGRRGGNQVAVDLVRQVIADAEVLDRHLRSYSGRASHTQSEFNLLKSSFYRLSFVLRTGGFPREVNLSIDRIEALIHSLDYYYRDDVHGPRVRTRILPEPISPPRVVTPPTRPRVVRPAPVPPARPRVRDVR